MKNKDIQELQSILKGDYIEESTSRSLKEVKQYQQKQTSMLNDKTKKQLKMFLRNKLSRNSRNQLVCNIRKDIHCKTDKELAMFDILKNVCDRYGGYTKLERIDGKRKIVKSDTYTAEKMRICELFGLDGKKYGIEEEKIHDDWIYLKFNEFNNIRNIFPINKRAYYRFIHFTRKKNLTELAPALGSSHFNSGYANDTVFFFAIKRGAYMPDVLRRGLNYGENAYEYIPKSTDKIYLDFTDTKPNMRDSVIPVLIETKRALPVKKIEFDREGFKESYIDENIDDDYITEANEESKKARKNAQEFMRKEYGKAHPTSMTSKQRNRMKRWLTDNDYDPKTETIATDIIDKNTGKPVRVNVGTNAYALDPDILGHPAQAFAVPNKEEYRKYLSDTLLRDGRGYINMPLSEMKRHPSVSNGISKHEEGHIADMQYGEKMVGKRNGRRKLEKINTKDYGPHLNQDELAADVYSVQHNKYKDKLGFIKRLSSSDVKARKGLRHDLYKVYKSFYDGNLKDVDMTDVNKLKTILKNMIKDSETELKDLKQFEKLNDNDAFRANVIGIENGIKSYKRLLGKVENITPDEFKGEFKLAVFNSYKPYFVEVLKVFDKESEFRADFAKRYIKEFATEYEMSTLEVIQEMYLQDMEDYVFQEESESIESYIDETIERFDAFMEEFNNGQIGDSEFIMESAQDNEYAKIVRDYIKKSGRRYFRYKRGEDHLPKEVEDKIFDLAKKIVEFPPNGDYSQYKMYYQSFCRIVNYPLDTVIMGMMINDEHKGYINMGALGGYRGAKRCVLKPGTHLFHSSDNPNLTMINPNHFKGKPNIVEIGDMEIPTGDYDSYYACPRIYFHVEKMGSRKASARGTVKYDSNNMPIIENKPTSGHMYMYIVKPTDRIFFDPELNATGDKDGAVYMLIDKPVRLTKIY